MIPPLIQFLIFFTAYFLPFFEGLELIWNLMPEGLPSTSNTIDTEFGCLD